MSSASPGAERAALAILFEMQEVVLRRDGEHMRANLGTDGVRGERRCRDGKVEEEVLREDLSWR